MITCSSCGKTVDGEVAGKSDEGRARSNAEGVAEVDDSPCPQCGTPLLVGKPPELDPAWVAEKQAKIDAAAPLPVKKKGGYWLLGAVMAVMIGAIVVMVAQRAPSMHGGAKLGDIEITVTAPKKGTVVVVDGAPAGETPLVLRLKGGTTPIKIIGNNVAIVVVPDRDRTVNLVPRKKSP
jgi:hypothetical protein